MLGVKAGRFDDEIEFVGSVDLAGYTVGRSGSDALRPTGGSNNKTQF
jgi:hypothetical protein